ncbi:MAG TPA: prepilin-type N-terminal cleavage/methylation domain-containing protein [bacterium]|mgnify:CR=1 FL=1|nr:prepilin-type N-terminal cleavage/methylation domain-containing protein [bacterium]HPN81203.1 prepilin-type N-terminal cleavage/methylation domain-containing protein [bacterium]HPW39500.1 prepilin-type N-terminal cleavage/methylation domain-containing protein [bacterium]
MFKHKKNYQAGFTLAEMMVVLGIIGLMASYVVVNFRRDEKVRALKQTAEAVFSDLKTVQTMALAGSQVQEQYPDSYSFLIKECSGVCSYSLVGNVNGSSLDYQVVNIDNDKIGIAFYDAELNNNEGESAEFLFQLPRGNLAISRASESVEEIKLIFSHSEVADYQLCLTANKISGRMYLTYNCKE